MRKVNKEFLDKCKDCATDYMMKSNNELLRERYVFFFEHPTHFTCVEGNTEGWFTEDKDKGFSESIFWLTRG